jgi:hypothetical protein
MKTVITLSLLLTAPLFSAEPASPFNGKDLSGWLFKGDSAASKWTTGEPAMDPANNGRLTVNGTTGAMINQVGGHKESIDIYSEAKFGSMRLEIEVMVPKGANSGIYVMGEYEVQVFDSFGVEKPGGGDMGAIYGANPPAVNASKAPGEWQSYIIEFQAPAFNEKGEKTANARFLKVVLNGKTLHENVEMKGPTPGGVTGKEAATGPLMFQGDHGPVAYRNIRVTPLE